MRPNAPRNEPGNRLQPEQIGQRNSHKGMNRLLKDSRRSRCLRHGLGLRPTRGSRRVAHWAGMNPRRRDDPVGRSCDVASQASGSWQTASMLCPSGPMTKAA